MKSGFGKESPARITDIGPYIEKRRRKASSSTERGSERWKNVVLNITAGALAAMVALQAVSYVNFAFSPIGLRVSDPDPFAIGVGIIVTGLSAKILKN